MDDRHDILLQCQECSGSGSNLSMVLKCIDGTGSNPRVSYVRGVRWVRDTRFDDTVPCYNSGIGEDVTREETPGHR